MVALNRRCGRRLSARPLPDGVTGGFGFNGDGLRFSRTDANGTGSFAWNGKVLDAQLGAGNTGCRFAVTDSLCIAGEAG